MLDLAQQVGGQHGDHGQRQQQRSRQSEDDGQRHRDEELAFEVLQGEQRQEHRDDDQDAGRHRYRDLAHRPVDDVQTRQLATGRIGGQTLDDVLDHHHRGIHQHADGNGQPSQTHQVGGHADEAHQDEGDQRRQRKYQGNRQRCANVAEEQGQQHDDQHGGLDQRLGHSPYRFIDQRRAIVEAGDGDAFR